MILTSGSTIISSAITTPRITSTTINPSRTTLKPVSTSTKPLICNYEGEYNGIQGVDWPPVNPVEFSIVNCINGKGFMKCKCLCDEKSDGEMPDMSECWINDILDKIDYITQIDEVEDILSIVLNRTENINSQLSSDSLEKVVTIIDKLDVKVENFEKEVDLNKIITLSKSFTNVLSNLIDQNKVRDNSTAMEKTEISSKYNRLDLF